VNVHDIVRGTDAGSLPVSFFPGQQFTINMATARAIDLYPSLLVMVDADLLHEERTDIERRLTLAKSVQEALLANRDIMVAQKSVAAGVQAVRERLAELLPRIDLATGARIIDEDRARASGGQAPERSWTGSVSGSQIIYSDRIWSDFTTEKHFQEARNEILRSTELDIIRATAVAYLNILRASAIEQILKENLRLTRANLERAEVRVDVGIAGPEEIFRWESEVANGRQDVLRAESITMNRMTILNRLMHRPLHEDFILEEVTVEDPAQVLVNELFFTLIENPKDLQVFREFMVAQGLVFSPLLSRLDAEIAAQDRRVTEAKRSFWLPDFSLNAEVDEILAEDGAGQRGAVPSDFNGTDWSVGVFASIPIFNSGGKTATLNRRREERAGLRAERESATERVKEGIIINVNRTRSSYPGIGLSRDAAEAARRNLDLVTDSYERGIKSIIDLLDAQNQSLVSEQQAANAGYDFLVDLMNLQRAVGQFDFLIDPQKKEDLARKYKEFAEKRGVKPKEP
jgi:outer membrane protein TolC